MSPWRMAVAVLALAAIAVSVWQMERSRAGLEIRDFALGETPVTMHALPGADGPAVVIAHGFAGSRQLMAPFAVSLAQNGYRALSFDFRGHGRNPQPLTGDVTAEDGATAALLAETATVIEHAAGLPGVEGRIALLGHSMASDIVVRAAIAEPRVDATVAVSMFTREVTAEAPANLLVIVGAWERFLAAEALAAVRLATGGPAEVSVTYGSVEDGSARRAVLADNVEHLGVLYSRESLSEAVSWLDGVFGDQGTGGIDVRGPWIALLLTGIAALGWPLAALLPRLEPARTRGAGEAGAIGAGGGAGARLGWGRLLPVLVVPAIATPLLLLPLPTDFLPVLVADYLAVHFALYGALMALGLWVAGGWPVAGPSRPVATALAVLAVAVFGVGAIGLALDRYFASFWPQGGRVTLVATLLAGTAPYLLAEAWATRGAGAPRGAAAVATISVLLSLALAVALNLEALFFLIIILPVVVLFFLLYGMFASWAARATGQPAVPALANALALAWALGVTFPLLAG